MKKLLILTILAGLFVTCTGENPVDPTLFNGPFTGYIHTNEFGDVLGRVGSDTDWRLYYGSSPYVNALSISEQNNQTLSQVFAKELPDHFGLGPAYPNPTNDLFSVAFELAHASDVLFTVIDKNYTIVYQFSASYEAGFHVRHIDIADSFDYYYEMNMYRVYIDINGYITGFGDVLFYEPYNVTDIY